MEIGKWVLGGLAWLISVIITYYIGKKSKVDDIRLKKTYEIAEEVAVLIQKDHHDRELLIEEFNENFGHIPDRKDAVENFHRFPSLYESMRKEIMGLPEQINKLQDLNRKAAIYFREDLTRKIEDYITMARFTYLTDGGLLFDTYLESFFDNLLDAKRIDQRRVLYKKIIKRLQRLKP